MRPLAPPAATRVRGGRRSPPKWHTRSLGVKTSIPSHRTDQAEWAKHCGAAAQWRQCRHRIPRPRGSVRCTSTGGCMHACCTRACSRVGLLSVWRAPIQPAQLFPLHALHAPPPPPSPPRSATQVTMQVWQRGEPSPGSDVAGVSPVPVQMWQGSAQSRCRCGRGEPSPGADVAGVSPVLAQMGRVSPVAMRMGQG